MSKIYINCICKKKFEVDIMTGFFTCPNCKRTYVRYFDQKEDTYKITVSTEKS